MNGNVETVKVGIAGLGRSGWNIHARLLDMLPDQFRITAVCDKKPERCSEAKDRFGCNTYIDFNKFLQDQGAELVVIAVPSFLHADYSIQALKAGKSVVCEKPMATSLAEADKMIRTSARTGRLLTIFQNRRYSKQFLSVKNVIDSGKLGRIVMIRISVHWFRRRWDWQTLRSYGGGELRNSAPHYLDMALILFGDQKPELFVDIQKTLTLGDTEDHVKIILKAAGAPTIEVEITNACAYPQPWLVMGTQGGLCGTSEKIQWKYFDPNELIEREVSTEPTPDRSYNYEELPLIEEDCNDVSPNSGWEDFYKDLYKTLRRNAPLAVTPESVRRQMWIIDQCEKMCPL